MLQALPAFIPGFWIIAAARICAGLGMGIIYPSSAAYVMSLFKGDEANKLMGIQQYDRSHRRHRRHRGFPDSSPLISITGFSLSHRSDRPSVCHTA